MRETMNRVAGVVLGEITGAAADGRPLVTWGAPPAAPRAAHGVWFEREVDWARCRGLRVVLGFVDGDEARPIVLGLCEAPPIEPPPVGAEPEVLHLRSERELVLECGKARIALRADGRITILGGYVVSRSTGVNKVQGGSVQIN
jgi:hypothetical protein